MVGLVNKVQSAKFVLRVLSRAHRPLLLCTPVLEKAIQADLTRKVFAGSRRQRARENNTAIRIGVRELAINRG